MTRPSDILRWTRRAVFGLAILLNILLVVAWAQSRVRRDDISRAWPVAWTSLPAPTVPPNTACHEAHVYWIASSGAGVLGATWATTEHAVTFQTTGTGPFVATWNHDVRPPSMPTPAGDNARLESWGFGLSLERTPWRRVEMGAGGQFWTRGWRISAACPYWCLVFPLSALLAFSPERRALSRRWKWRRLGMCTTCGYDLRAHVPGQRCPECGATISAPHAGRSWLHILPGRHAKPRLARTV